MDGAATSPPGDPIEAYLSVLNALENLQRGAPVLGEVLNGMVGDNIDEEEVPPDEDGEETGSEMTSWARRLGAQLAYASHYTAFACGGAAEVTIDTYEYNNSGGGTALTILHYLRVLRGEDIVASWPLNAPVPVDELLSFCSPAHFGDLRTQTTVRKQSVRTAMEIPVSVLLCRIFTHWLCILVSRPCVLVGGGFVT